MYKYEKAAIERFGNNFIRNKTDELIFNCKKCGRPKLYVDTKTGVYHCFRCNFKGKIKTRATLAGVREKYNMDTLIKQTKENKDEQLTFDTNNLDENILLLVLKECQKEYGKYELSTKSMIQKIDLLEPLK